MLLSQMQWKHDALFEHCFRLYIIIWHERFQVDHAVYLVTVI